MFTAEPLITPQWVLDNVHENLAAGGAVGFAQSSRASAFRAFDAAHAGLLAVDETATPLPQAEMPPPPPPIGP